MLTSSSHGLKATLLRTSKEGGLRAVSSSSSADVNNGVADRHLLLYSMYSTDPMRALSRLHSALLEGNVCALWQQTKQRLKSRLQKARSAYSSGGSSQRSSGGAAALPGEGRVSSAQLEPLYGSNGVFRSAVMYVLAHASRGFMTRLNSTHVEGLGHMEAALAREPGRPLITVCNHVASMDDPLVMATILPPAAYADPEQLRWTLCASDRCFHRSLLVPFFRAAKVLPVERGAGMFQPGLAAAEARLAAGDWVHIFPEGTRSRDGRMGPVRKGVGRLVASCADARPLIVPFVHSGMEEVLPKGALLPKTDREVQVLVGEPIDVSDLLSTASAQAWSDDALYSAIANRIGGAMALLKARLDGAPLDAAGAREQAAAQQAVLDAGLDLYDPADNAHRAVSLWERAAFRAQHREWAAGGVARAKARLAAAAEASLAAAVGFSSGVAGQLGGDDASSSSSSDGAVAAMLQRWQAQRQQRLVARDAAEQQRQQWPLARIKAWALASGGSEAEYLSRQRSIGMMQLLQARV